MGRTSTRKSRTSRTVPTRTASQMPTRQPTQTAARPQGSTFGDAIKSGVGLGIGMEAVRGVTGMMKSSPSQVTNENPCIQPHNELLQCLNENILTAQNF